MAEHIKVCDHLGNEFVSRKGMAKYWEIDYQTLSSRLKLGWTLKEALETVVGNSRKLIRDHTGRSYSSISEMCANYTISCATYSSRRNIYGWSIKDALTIPVDDSKYHKDTKLFEDHLGNKYGTLDQMCSAYGIASCLYKARVIKLGWSKEEALTIPRYGKKLKTKEVDSVEEDKLHKCNR